MTYAPLSEVRQELNVQWYRSAMSPAKFRELQQKDDRKAWFQAGGHFGLFLLTGTAVFLSWTNGSWVLFFLALFCHGTVASFFRGTAVHELGHGTVFKTKRGNDVFLYLFSLISWWNPYDYALSHTYHHRYTLHPEGDREVLLPLHPSVGRFFLLQMFTLNLSTLPERTFGKGGLLTAIWVTLLDAFGKAPYTDVPSQEWLLALHNDQPEEYRKSKRWSRILLLFHGAVLLVSIVSGLWVLPLILSAPSYIANWLSYFCGLPQHCGLQDNVPDFRKSVRSMRLPAFVEFLYWRMNWHTEHHMFAGVPCYNLKALAAEIKDDMPEPRTLVGAWCEMLETWEKQKENPDYFFDTPLPETAKTKRARAGTVEETSIGDLAPEGLT